MHRPDRRWVADTRDDTCGEKLLLAPAGPRSRKRLFFSLPVLGLLAAAIGCAHSKVVYEEIFGDDSVHVRLAERVDKSGMTVPRAFDHPWRVEISVLNDMLENVRYEKGKMLIGGGETVDVFPSLPRHALLKPIQQAFAKAGADQAVDFSFVEEKSTLKVFRRVYLTDGIMFRKKGELNIAFRNVAFEQIGGGAEESYEPNREDPLEAPMRTSWTLVAGEGQSLAQNEGKGVLGSNTYTNWIKLNLAWPWGVAEAATVGKPLPGVVDDLESALPKEPTPPEPAPLNREELEKRLQFLEELRSEGLISERSYMEKKLELDRLYNRLPAQEGLP